MPTDVMPDVPFRVFNGIRQSGRSVEVWKDPDTLKLTLKCLDTDGKYLLKDKDGFRNLVDAQLTGGRFLDRWEQYDG